MISWDFWTVAISAISVCNAARLPSPANPLYVWRDEFTVYITWSLKKPSGLPDSCQIKYLMVQPDLEPKLLHTPSYQDIWTTEGNEAAVWTYRVKSTVENCSSWLDSQEETIIVRPKRLAEAVKHIECVLYSSVDLNCSWIPVNPSLDLKLSYRLLSSNDKPLKVCEQPYSSGREKGCSLRDAFLTDRVLLHLNGTLDQAEWSSTFKRIPRFHVKPHPPKLSVTREGPKLKLNWTQPENWNCKSTCWIYRLCFTECGQLEGCQDVTDKEIMLNYVEHCRYDFKIGVMMSDTCGKGQSDFSEVVSYGADDRPDGSLVVAVVIIPVILSACIIVSCFCFRRHRNDIWPDVPNPSELLKGMMNGKELQASEDLYVPLPENVDVLTIIPGTKNDALAQNR
ncbi:interleukin-13 receptor subunit alpha-1 [Thalassophryne amazonica]|uniref:interleukin-13 receptor subunit alpha-1 n=1 Tax=Thalassophryne amazonica TaxID=390379 RepID=UPI001471C131|nr:interleukin-13 receptor subunit alpha-1 [Thalassophryne amazonica]